MIAKLIVSVDEPHSFADCVAKALTAIEALQLEGISTNQHLLANILAHPAFAANKVYTSFMTTHQQELSAVRKKLRAKKAKAATADVQPRAVSVNAPFPGQIVEVRVKQGEHVKAGQVVVVLSAMKMMNEIAAAVTGTVESIGVAKDQQVNEGDVLLVVHGVPAPADDDDDDDEASPETFVPRGAAAGGVEGSGQTLPAAYGTITAQAPSTLKLRTKVNKEDATFKARCALPTGAQRPGGACSCAHVYATALRASLRCAANHR
jgi:acetyl/propionyl-CoA carboxylase alpha subunit